MKDSWEALTNAFKERISGNDGVVNDMIVLHIRQQRDESCALILQGSFRHQLIVITMNPY